MIVGQVTSDDEAVVEITLIDDTGQRILITRVIDTGFTGYLTLPQQIVQTANFLRLADEDIVLADGSISRRQMYHVTVRWDGENRSAFAYAMNARPLIGMKMLRGTILTVEFEETGEVTIEPI